MTDNKLSELKAAAMAATPGPWSWKLDGIFYYLSPEGVNDPLFRIIDDGSAWGEYAETIEHDGPDARYIAAANPAVVLDLLAELDAKDKRIAELEAKLATPVRLPELLASPSEYASSILWAERDTHNATVIKCAGAIRSAGFTVEGDE